MWGIFLDETDCWNRGFGKVLLRGDGPPLNYESKRVLCPCLVVFESILQLNSSYNVHHNLFLFSDLWSHEMFCLVSCIASTLKTDDLRILTP